jgi:inner membrane protein involved in colicin E2 resistance
MNKYFLEMLTASVMLAIIYLLIRMLLDERGKSAQAVLVAASQEAVHEADAIVAEHTTVPDTVDRMQSGAF